MRAADTAHKRARLETRAGEWRSTCGSYSVGAALSDAPARCSILHEDTHLVGFADLPDAWPAASGPPVRTAELPCGHTYHVSALALHFLSNDMRYLRFWVLGWPAHLARAANALHLLGNDSVGPHTDWIERAGVPSVAPATRASCARTRCPRRSAPPSPAGSPPTPAGSPPTPAGSPPTPAGSPTTPRRRSGWRYLHCRALHLHCRALPLRSR